MWIHAPPKKYRYGKFRFILLQSRREEYSPLCMRHRPTLKHIEGQKGHMIVMRRWKPPLYLLYTTVNLREGAGYTIQILWEGCEGIGYLELLQPL